jgi:hypothetical protein
MTDEQRISRAALLKRAAAVAGAAYLAPVLTSNAAANVEACKGRCGPPGKPGKKGLRKCRLRGGPNCICNENGKCRMAL